MYDRYSRRAPAMAGAALALVSSLAVGQKGTLPTPESVFGFPVGADYKLFTYDQSIDYFKKLAAATPSRMKLITVGKTSFGKPWTVAIISSPANLARLEQIRQTNQRLAHPDGLTDAEAKRLAREGRAFVDISGGSPMPSGRSHSLRSALDPSIPPPSPRTCSFARSSSIATRSSHSSARRSPRCVPRRFPSMCLRCSITSRVSR